MSRQPGGKLPIHTAIDITRDICRGVRELHARNVAVLDLKPDNVLMTEEGTAVLADFGISRIVTSTLGKVGGSMSYHMLHLKSMDRHNPQVEGGTHGYMPPEQMEYGERRYQGPLCDIWSLACTLIHMVNGQMPCSGLNQMQFFKMVRMN